MPPPLAQITRPCRALNLPASLLSASSGAVSQPPPLARITRPAGSISQPACSQPRLEQSQPPPTCQITRPCGQSPMQLALSLGWSSLPATSTCQITRPCGNLPCRLLSASSGAVSHPPHLPDLLRPCGNLPAALYSSSGAPRLEQSPSHLHLQITRPCGGIISSACLLSACVWSSLPATPPPLARSQEALPKLNPSQLACSQPRLGRSPSHTPTCQITGPAVISPPLALSLVWSSASHLHLPDHKALRHLPCRLLSAASGAVSQPPHLPDHKAPPGSSRPLACSQPRLEQSPSHTPTCPDHKALR
uniref:Uncharacterized protein n=1 Tax=Sphaerodactylus townsendi TaxID=933632 RepID=A0ACB8FRB8_9SAUR